MEPKYSENRLAKQMDRKTAKEDKKSETPKMSGAQKVEQLAQKILQQKKLEKKLEALKRRYPKVDRTIQQPPKKITRFDEDLTARKPTRPLLGCPPTQSKPTKERSSSKVVRKDELKQPSTINNSTDSNMLRPGDMHMPSLF